MIGGPTHCASSRASAVAGYQIVVRSACVFAPRQSYGSAGMKSREVTPALNTASACAALTVARTISNSAGNLIRPVLYGPHGRTKIQRQGPINNAAPAGSLDPEIGVAHHLAPFFDLEL